MRILFGNPNYLIDVSQFILQKINIFGKFLIPPRADQRNKLFERDPTEHNLFIIELENDNMMEIQKDRELVMDKNVHTGELRLCTIETKIQEMHYNLFFKYGYLTDALSEQKMAFRFLTGNETVLEIGGNVGRNSVMIASLLNNQSNLVVLECDLNSATKLRENRDVNGLKFHIEPAALSARRLWQKDWDTVVSDSPVENHVEVQIIKWQELQEKYVKTFDTLVLDCEGAFYYILQDFPELLTGIKKILVENDYRQIEHKTYVDNVLKIHGFNVIYQEAGGSNMCDPSCESVFYETWAKP